VTLWTAHAHLVAVGDNSPRLALRHLSRVAVRPGPSKCSSC
jgi:hypothetical protein